MKSAKYSQFPQFKVQDASYFSDSSFDFFLNVKSQFEPPYDKTNNVVERPAKTQISLGIRPVWSESSLSAWKKLGSLATHWAHSEDSDQTGRMPRLIWVFAGRTAILLVLSRGGSFDFMQFSCNLYKGSFVMIRTETRETNTFLLHVHKLSFF